MSAAAHEHRPDDVIDSTSGVSLFDGSPFVVIRWAQEAGQLTPERARELALSILEAADAAEFDAGLIRVLRAAGIGDEYAVRLLNEIRGERE